MPQPDSRALNPTSTVSPLVNGIEVQAGDLRERIVALRDDVLRVTYARGTSFPEDASWAVLATARHSAVPVTMETNADHFGFRTRALAVEIDRSTLQLVVRDLSDAVLQQDARPVRFDGDAFRVYKSMPRDEHYFGLGDKTGPLDRRNEAFTLWNTDAYRFQESTDPLYKSIPYFMTFRAGTALGVLLDDTWRTSFDFGKESSDIYSFGASAGPLDYYLFYGPAPRQVIETYAWLTGTPPLPPLWAFGFQQSRYSYMSQSRVLQVANRLRADSIPADAIYLDIDFQDRNRPFTVNRVAFPDIAGMVVQLKAINFHVVAITDLHIANVPAHNYFPYDSGIAGDHFVKNPDGSVFTGRVWPGPSVFPDFTRQQTRAWWGTLYRDLHRDGIDGFWNDMNEPSVFDTPNLTMPENAVHRIDEPGFAARTATHAEIHDVYGMENSRATFDGLLKLDPNSRPFVLTRATYAGGQRYAATWTGDNSSSWNHLRLATPMLENLGLSGFAFSGADVGGYAGTPSPELLTKWFEVAAFQPIDRDHTEKGTGDQEPWVGGSDQEAIRRRFIDTRYQLMPYLYTLAEEASRTGLPMLRPLFLEFPDAFADRHPIDIDNNASGEFLLGADLLIAPPPYLDERDGYSIEFPSRDWYDFWTGAKIPAPAPPSPDTSSPSVPTGPSVPLSARVTPDPAQLPVYVRAGSILPIAPVTQSTNEIPRGALTLRVYAGDNCTGEVYQDDGKTYAFQHGAYLRMKFNCQRDAEGMHLKIGSHEGSYPAWWKEIQVEIYGLSRDQDEIFVNSRRVSERIEVKSHSLSFFITDGGTGANIDVLAGK
ncbi:glycoside hydrolase family 31 protein [Acidicapsa acidisoli]|uniref:glycoside hydrolase family 31 protein n=1 Tax=Acidicapsa acidisoli TaxID=1615681 RepID=UPI0021E07B5A|nr:TIM-barrel domain-containing protein [Acidicapsa acidisoli]